ncbi:zinc finger CCCH domain-containing protein 13-like isoform X2 [Phragmites australis]|uniref:zinc finger CCCH domain-containing protein 13-like isoform X2 n=1 Tax=Phragmites australis TaxID=29695 RepID=UPI002D79A3D2|nr:zinc finger CCCH domain-containing protein 13-like isoform X2 [Phragmites australis]XP_062234316.1 zinc finger CCCH domain-containing protein 13-like isoform X2 [Phragmites australis]XP_062234317.1 zinc finger CCCH domain-containing protein 13-like isoform X2 [Phragmites australis]
MAQGCGRRDSSDHDFRVRPERRHSPRGRYSTERDTRGHSFRDQKPSSQDRGSSHSRSPIRKSERKHRKSPDGGKTDSSESFRTSDNEDSEKDERHSSSDEKKDCEPQPKQIHMDVEALLEDKSKLEMMLEKKIEEVSKLSSIIGDLESQLDEVKEDCQRMTSKTKKVIKAHGRYMKAREDLKRSQARFERLADLLASDTLKPCTKEQGSSGNANEDQYNALEMSPNDRRQNHVSTAKKRSIVLSTSEETKTGKKRRESDDDIMIPMSVKYRQEDALEPFNNSKGNGTPKSFSAQKKLGEGDYKEERNIVSLSNVFTNRYNGEDEEVHVD